MLGTQGTAVSCTVVSSIAITSSACAYMYMYIPSKVRVCVCGGGGGGGGISGHCRAFEILHLNST